MVGRRVLRNNGLGILELQVLQQTEGRYEVSLRETFDNLMQRLSLVHAAHYCSASPPDDDASAIEVKCFCGNYLAKKVVFGTRETDCAHHH